ncbi:MAG: DUF11 domain-containing protein, partial [Solirubrobacteraceae bacterium]|nr:DUF11 domain-containing protein [Solirubrobacteraceae bacterium]
MRRFPVLVLPALLLALALAAPSSGLAATSPAPAERAQSAGSGLFVTIAARFCREYTDITANRARNNIQESLEDLGKDTPYQAGQAISPAIEDANQPNCTPLPDWQFKLGKGIKTKAVTGPWGALSIVTEPYAGTPTTKAETPLLNADAQPTGREIKGAVTIELTRAQADRASRPNSLWIQGGTPTDPILNQVFPGQYGFGALRCAVDNLNGDNVEWIGFPEGAEHVFCYAYYVKPPPTSGTIIVRKRVEAPAGTAKQQFRFEGNISYTADNSFSLNAGPGQDAQETFYRAEVGGATGAKEPWNFTEQPTPGWQLVEVSCRTETGRSAIVASVQTGRTDVTLAAGDTVTCTYTNRLRPPPAGLELFKTTFGNTGRFGFNVSGPQPASVTATTTERGVPTAGVPARLELPAGAYEVRESLIPISPSGTWRLTRVTCNGQDQANTNPVRLTLVSGQGTVCVYENTFVPNGSIKLRKTTRGGVGTTGFVITKVDNQGRQLQQSATTTQEGVPVLATGDPSTRLPLGRYVIQETTPSEPASGEWTLDSLLCDDLPVPTEQGRARIELTTENPSVDCTFTNLFTRGGTSGGGENNGGGGGGGGGGDTGGSGNVVNPETDLTVTKSVQPKVIDQGEVATYTITVRNTSRVTAEEVTVAEQPRGRVDKISLTTTKGTCVATNPA